MVGEVIAATFIGFALTLLFGGALVDLRWHEANDPVCWLRLCARPACLSSSRRSAAVDSSYWLIYTGFLLTGLGWGAVEAATNPLVATIYPDEKTHRLNILHAWWPAGIVIGGLTGLGL